MKCHSLVSAGAASQLDAVAIWPYCALRSLCRWNKVEPLLRSFLGNSLHLLGMLISTDMSCKACEVTTDGCYMLTRRAGKAVLVCRACHLARHADVYPEKAEASHCLAGELPAPAEKIYAAQPGHLQHQPHRAARAGAALHPADGQHDPRSCHGPSLEGTDTQVLCHLAYCMLNQQLNTCKLQDCILGLHLLLLFI